jgi:hypothetical protein
MRTALYMATGLAAAFSIVPAALAQDSRVLDPGKSAGTGIEAQDRQTHDERSDGQGPEARTQPGTSIAVPIGRVSVGPEFVDGESIYVRRAVRDGMAIVEVSTTPFAPEFAVADQLVIRPDQPAPW